MQIEKSSETARSSVPLGSVALAPVISEVRIGAPQPPMGAYNRTYNRHNR